MTTPHLARARSSRRNWTIAMVLLALAAAYFAFRGPGRVDHDRAADFALIHAATATWVRAENPYDAQTVGRVWLEAGGSPAINPATRGAGPRNVSSANPDKDLLYPPSAFLILAPLVLTGARAGLLVWTALSIASALLAAVVAAQLAGLGFGFRAASEGGKPFVHSACQAEQARRGKGGGVGGSGGWGVVAAMLALAPGHTNFNVGQSAHLVLGIIALAYGVRLWKGGVVGEIVCGVLLGAAAALKPQVGLAFLGVELLFARWVTLLAGGATGALLLAAGGAWLWLADIDWIAAWRANIAAFKADGAGNPAPPNPWRYQIVSLHYPLHAFISSAAIVNALVLLVCAGVAAWFWRLRRRAEGMGRPVGGMAGPLGGRGPELIDIAMAAVLGLLFFYHRFYDAVVLIFPIALGVSLLVRGRRLEGLALLVPLAVFLIPGAAALFAIQDRLPGWLTGSLFWEGLVMPHQPWMILAAAVVLLWLARRCRAGEPAGEAGLPETGRA